MQSIGMATSTLCFYIVVVLAHLFFLTQGQTVTCMYADSILANGTCFRYNTTKVTWYAAKASCESWNGALAMVNSSAQIKTILKNATAYSDTWIGANDIDVEGTLVWDHDKSPALASLTGLLTSGLPSAVYDTYDCAEIYKITATVLQIYVEPCTYLYDFLCMEMHLPTTTAATDSPTTTITTTTSTPTNTTTTSTTTTTTPTTTTTTPTTTTTTPTTTTTTSTSTTGVTTTTSTALSSTATIESTNTTREETTPPTTTAEKAIMRGGAEVVKVNVLLYILPALVSMVFKRDGRLNLQ